MVVILVATQAVALCVLKAAAMGAPVHVMVGVLDAAEPVTGSVIVSAAEAVTDIAMNPVLLVVVCFVLKDALRPVLSVEEAVEVSALAAVVLAVHQAAAVATTIVSILARMAVMVSALLLVAAVLVARDAEVLPALESALVIVIPSVLVAEEAAAEAVTLLAIQTAVLIAIVQQNKIGGKRIYENYC
jgi:hypothetical protein